MNPNIPDRAKDFMQGNREEYCRRVQQYLEKLKLPSSAEEFPKFFDQHKKNAQEFTQGILRPFQILQEFFAHESKVITLSLAEIEKNILELREQHEQAKIDAYDPLLTESEILLTKHNQSQAMEKERAEMEKQLEEAVQKIKMLNVEEERLLKDPKRLAALDTLREAQRRKQAHEQTIRDIFKNFEPALRRFHRMATRNTRLVGKYLRDPVQTLIEDMHLDIQEVISDIIRLMEFDRLQLGDKKEYVTDALAHLNKDFLGTWLREYGRYAKDEKDAQHAIEECEASKTLVKIQRLREETRRNNQLTEQRLALVRKDLDKLNLDQLKSELEKNIKNVTNIQATITF